MGLTVYAYSQGYVVSGLKHNAGGYPLLVEPRSWNPEATTELALASWLRAARKS
jgi:hypothetical protein